MHNTSPTINADYMAHTAYVAAVEGSAAAAGKAGCECDCACICNRAGNVGKSLHALSVHSTLPAVCHLRARRRGWGRLFRRSLLFIVIPHPNARRSRALLPEVAVPVLPCECKAPLTTHSLVHGASADVGALSLGVMQACT